MTTFLESGILSRQLSASEQKQLEDELNAMIDQSNQTLMREEEQNKTKEGSADSEANIEDNQSSQTQNETQNGDDQGEFDLEALLNSASSDPLVFDKTNNNGINHQELRTVAAAAGISLDDFDMPAFKKRKLSMSNSEDSQLLQSLLSSIDSQHHQKARSEPVTTIPSPSAESPAPQDNQPEPVNSVPPVLNVQDTKKKEDLLIKDASATHTPPASTGVSPAASNTTASTTTTSTTTTGSTITASNVSTDTTNTNKSSTTNPAAADKPIESPKPTVESSVPKVTEKKTDNIQPPQPQQPQKSSYLLSPPSSTHDDGVVAVVSKPVAPVSSNEDVIEVKSVAKETRAPQHPPKPEINADMIKSIKEQMISRHTLLTTYNTLKSSFTHVCNELKDAKTKAKESERLRQLLANENSSLRAQNQNSLKERDDARLQIRQLEAEIHRLKQKAGES
ncbi:hypothetical protein TRVA0_019S02124 [Trichomonascus vanleenenianus]|uniref:uncharacterized protein n=1 Tax=Trichomonascus vanleenenianus TaxID=2268995 RepID=UPI003ECA9258